MMSIGVSSSIEKSKSLQEPKGRLEKNELVGDNRRQVPYVWMCSSSYGTPATDERRERRLAFDLSKYTRLRKEDNDSNRDTCTYSSSKA